MVNKQQEASVMSVIVDTIKVIWLIFVLISRNDLIPKVCPNSRVSVMSSEGVQCLHVLN